MILLCGLLGQGKAFSNIYKLPDCHAGFGVLETNILLQKLVREFLQPVFVSQIFFFSDRVSCAQAGLEFSILLPLPLIC